MAKKVIPRGQYFASHYSEVSHAIPISKNEIINGMVCKIDYRADYRVFKKTSLYLIISPSYEGKIHAIDLDYVTPLEFKRVIKLCKDKSTAQYKKGAWVSYIFPFISSERSLYDQITSIFQNEYCYRKLKPSKVRDMKLCIMKNMEKLHKLAPTEVKEDDKKEDDKK
jgi:hypothetical protein